MILNAQTALDRPLQGGMNIESVIFDRGLIDCVLPERLPSADGNVERTAAVSVEREAADGEDAVVEFQRHTDIVDLLIDVLSEQFAFGIAIGLHE